MLEFNVAGPPLRCLPATPWDAIPGQARVRLPYIAAACFTWPALVLHDTTADLFVDEWILQPSCIQRTWACLFRLGMPMVEMVPGTVPDTLARFVAEHPHADFDLHKDDLQRVESVQGLT